MASREELEALSRSLHTANRKVILGDRKSGQEVASRVASYIRRTASATLVAGSAFLASQNMASAQVAEQSFSVMPTAPPSMTDAAASNPLDDIQKDEMLGRVALANSSLRREQQGPGVVDFAMDPGASLAKTLQRSFHPGTEALARMAHFSQGEELAECAIRQIDGKGVEGLADCGQSSDAGVKAGKAGVNFLSGGGASINPLSLNPIAETADFLGSLIRLEGESQEKFRTAVSFAVSNNIPGYAIDAKDIEGAKVTIYSDAWSGISQSSIDTRDIKGQFGEAVLESEFRRDKAYELTRAEKAGLEAAAGSLQQQPDFFRQAGIETPGNPAKIADAPVREPNPAPPEKPSRPRQRGGAEL